MRRQTLGRWCSGIATAAFVLLLVTVALCCLDGEGMGHHGLPGDFCALAIPMLMVSVSVGALLLLGPTPALGRPLFATVPLVVPKPPPRRLRSS